jgi:hypothetical protein
VWWFKPVIPATWEAEFRKINIQVWPGQKPETLSEKQTKKQKGMGYGSTGRTPA